MKYRSYSYLLQLSEEELAELNRLEDGCDNEKYMYGEYESAMD